MRNRRWLNPQRRSIQSYFVRERLLEHESAIEAYQKGGMVKAEIDGILAAEFCQKRCSHRLLRRMQDEKDEDIEIAISGQESAVRRIAISNQLSAVSNRFSVRKIDHKSAVSGRFPSAVRKSWESGFNGEPAARAYYFVSISEILRYKK